MIIKLNLMLQSFRQATSAVDQFVVLKAGLGQEQVPLAFTEFLKQKLCNYFNSSSLGVFSRAIHLLVKGVC